MSSSCASFPFGLILVVHFFNLIFFNASLLIVLISLRFFVRTLVLYLGVYLILPFESLYVWTYHQLHLHLIFPSSLGRENKREARQEITVASVGEMDAAGRRGSDEEGRGSLLRQHHRIHPPLTTPARIMR